MPITPASANSRREEVTPSAWLFRVYTLMPESSGLCLTSSTKSITAVPTSTRLALRSL